MRYPFMTLEDETEVVHSEILPDASGKEHVRVNFERPVDGGFLEAECWLPEYRWTEVRGYKDAELLELDRFLHRVAPIVIDLAREGGFSYAASA